MGRSDHGISQHGWCHGGGHVAGGLLKFGTSSSAVRGLSKDRSGNGGKRRLGGLLSTDYIVFGMDSNLTLV